MFLKSSLYIFWKTCRFRFEFLKDDYHNNAISETDYERIWIPNIEYIYVQEIIYDEYRTKVFVTKNSSDTTLSHDNDEIRIREVYSGSFNSLMKITKKRIKFACSFDYMESYPFKKQVCSFQFNLVGADSAVVLTPDNLEIESSRQIGHYDIERWTMKALENEDDEIEVSMVFKIDLISIFMVTYLPTILMNMINQATNYITSDNKYDIIFTVNITCMMVLASIYLSVSASLPITPAIKPVEFWLLLSLSYPFFIIVISILQQVQNSTLFHHKNTEHSLSES